MAENTKPGSKDITDLKARLGLKKQAAGGPGVPGAGPGPAAPFAPAPVPGLPGAPKPAGQVAPPGGGVPAPAGIVPPPGGIPAPHGAAIPAPPGFAAPEPAQPDPRRDPYAAQQAAMAASLAAFYTAGNALPGDASNVEGGKKGGPPLGLIGGIVGAAVIAGGLGYFVGNIKVARDQYAEATEQASQIKREVDGIKKQVTAAVSTFKEIKPGEPPSLATLEKLEKLDLKEPDATQKLFHTNYATFEPRLVRSMFDYYNSVTNLFKQINEHAARTKNDKEDLDKCFGGAKAQAAKSGPMGVVFDYSQKLPYAQIVALGGIVCPGGDPNKVDCAESEMKLRYRTTLSGGFSERPVKGLPKDIVIAVQPTELQKQLINGDPAQLACRDYSRRAAAILQTLSKLPDEEKAVLEGLDKRIKAPPV